ncbi:tRNA (guanine-N1)-methyltransferase [Altericista sp. CCNU0014]|uniref:tRNA (guanine-N1)-methyltransferase n=1 Tax=Altericista sp. CCNU0014 TaxID=3082949 RepID=UPI00384BC867
MDRTAGAGGALPRATAAGGSDDGSFRAGIAAVVELTVTPLADWYEEGAARFEIGAAFFKPETRVARDFGVLAAAVYRQQHPQLEVLDGMSGCGIRALRYALEAKADWLWVNEANPEHAAVLHQNVKAQLPPGQFRVTIGSVRCVLQDCLQQQRYFDLVDLDCFGSPAADLTDCIRATRLNGLMYLTTTDSRTCEGHNPAASLRHFGAYARAHPATREQGLRLLLGMVSQQAAMQGFAIAPLFSYFQGQTYRVMVRLVKGHHWSEAQSGFVGHCHACGHYDAVDWRRLSRAVCPHHETPLPLTLSGPLWLGPLHDLAYLTSMGDLAQRWGWQDRKVLLDLMAGEIPFPPYFFTLAELGRRAKVDIPKRSQLLIALKKNNYKAALTHIEPQAVKTDASILALIALAKELQSNFKKHLGFTNID